MAQPTRISSASFLDNLIVNGIAEGIAISEESLEQSFAFTAGPMARREPRRYRLKGTPFQFNCRMLMTQSASGSKTTHKESTS